jgi:hypothetical protein
MSFLTTSAASIHQLGAATAVARRPDETLAAAAREGATVKSWWTRSDAIADVMLSGGWLIEQHTLRTHRALDTATERAVRGKDIAVAGAMLTSVANLVVTGLMKRDFPEGIPVAGNGAPSRQAPAAAERYWRYLARRRKNNAVLSVTGVPSSSSCAPVATGVTAAGWLIERKKLQSRGLGREARSCFFSL